MRKPSASYRASDAVRGHAKRTTSCNPSLKKGGGETTALSSRSVMIATGGDGESTELGMKPSGQMGAGSTLLESRLGYGWSRTAVCKMRSKFKQDNPQYWIWNALLLPEPWASLSKNYAMKMRAK